ncbi:pseudouridylate synthase 7 homolog-like protein isoform X1 [Alligator sinensis]|uniref:Pseudouridylate synthase PUS7L n=1 Tax=Alligator sinensis TaxID=38654 RepID=A0A1U7R1Z4_ALLSI|nr:pseudouridylate synthase 7 homolog-like protein isoform X1 [Alligator sinensis]XP_006015985.1 pseudouridylate synthase 7 homolog-like protein isoform X1 [Alligator sinensis]
MLNSFSYVNDHIGFCGSVKNYPSDFVVTEIDVFGQLLSDTESSCAISETPLEQKSPYQQHHKRLRINAPELGIEDEHCQVDNLSHASEECLSSVKEKKERVTKTIPKCGIDDTDMLDSLLSKSVNELLSQFACNVKDAWNSENDQTPYSNEFSLGPIFEKENRACLHSAIRQKFPFLMTVTKNSEIIVKANADYRELCQFVTEEEAYDFFKFLDAKLETSKFSFKPDENKEHRKTVHHFISKKFGKLLETKSFSVTDFSGQQNTAIMVRFREKTCSRKRPAADCQEKQNLYTAFTLQKENLETLEAIGYLSSELGVLPSDFSYTGIKDKKAITYQAMVVKKVTPERMKKVGTAIVKKGMKVYNIHRVCQHLRLGQLKGNHFDITVRDLGLQQNDSSADVKERISEAIENIQTNGFVNYYGPQRFGQGQNVRTDQIGLALLNEEMVKAVKLFFTPEDTDDPVNQAKKYFLQTEDAKGTLARMPEFKVREKMILRALNRYGVNHEGCTRAWFSLPHSMRIFYVHAYCSKIWNAAASYRFKIYGSKVVEGDLVLSEENVDESSSLNDRVHIVTAPEESASNYTIHQVVLPMVGHSIKYPSNKVGQWYHEILAEDALQTCRFRLSALQLNIPGCYRHILKNVHNLSYRFLEDSKEGIKSEDSCHLDASKASLFLSFDLDPSCYATACLREILKCDI